MKVQASVLTAPLTDWTTATLEVEPPRAEEVLVRVHYAGLCRSDEHRRHGGTGSGGRYPLIGGHEGSGIVEAVGPGVTRFAPGDHVILSVLPQCGVCRYCTSGRSRMCDYTVHVPTGAMPDGTFRASLDGEPLGGFCMLGTFADHIVVSQASCVKIPEWFPMDVAALLSCGVPTGWGSAEYVGEVRAGDTVIVAGIGGVGINAVQGAAFKGASHVVAVDPVEWKREFARSVGATHTAANLEEAGELGRHLSRGSGADVVIVTVGVLRPEITLGALEATGKGARMVLTATADEASDVNVRVPGNRVTFFDVSVRGALLGGCNAHYDIPRLARLYEEGRLKLDELITKRYTVDGIAGAYADVRDGNVIRALVEHRH
ncbi:NDMA-dependent alcohol dehydrogenase [Amycolatopsis sp. K13G38]|uniref:NDMA-dependent alcohol dehydrogenase n=1 Tax=Amycolatopsis acididurans TaxID=2724524 RepID=A0ABX1J6U1_9PSEU|nr:NDMA-dependent alcohol dehydrogenase [Amycolatopsis acididurans]NKQ55517.1 NDMA-dependent alcohol dehydrogenase [Amycolatopsis acididurans]